MVGDGDRPMNALGKLYAELLQDVLSGQTKIDMAVVHRKALQVSKDEEQAMKFTNEALTCIEQVLTGGDGMYDFPTSGLDMPDIPEEEHLEVYYDGVRQFNDDDRHTLQHDSETNENENQHQKEASTWAYDE